MLSNVAETKAQISFAVTVKLICVFVFAFSKRWSSHVGAHFALIGKAVREKKFEIVDDGPRTIVILLTYEHSAQVSKKKKTQKNRPTANRNM